MAGRELARLLTSRGAFLGRLGIAVLVMAALWVRIYSVPELHQDPARLARALRRLLVGTAWTGTLLAILVGPVLGARAIDDERRRRSLELLVTAGVGEGQVFLAKLAALVAVFLGAALVVAPVATATLAAGGVDAVDLATAALAPASALAFGVASGMAAMSGSASASSATLRALLYPAAALWAFATLLGQVASPLLARGAQLLLPWWGPRVLVHRRGLRAAADALGLPGDGAAIALVVVTTGLWCAAALAVARRTAQRVSVEHRDLPQPWLVRHARATAERRWRAPVGKNPVAWRERATAVLLRGRVALLAAPVLVIVQLAQLEASPQGVLTWTERGHTIAFVSGFVAFLAALLGGIGAFTRERQSGLIDLLAISTLPRRRMVLGKLAPVLSWSFVFALPTVLFQAVGLWADEATRAALAPTPGAAAAAAVALMTLDVGSRVLFTAALGLAAGLVAANDLHAFPGAAITWLLAQLALGAIATLVPATAPAAVVLRVAAPAALRAAAAAALVALSTRTLFERALGRAATA